MDILVTIPIQHFIKKFLSKKVEVSPFVINNKCHISALLLEPIKKDYVPVKDELRTHFNDALTCKMNTVICREKKFTIDKDIVLRIDTLLREMFFDEFIHFVESVTSDKSVEIQEAIFKFTDYYDLQEDDIQFETLKKRYYRYRVPPRPIVKPTREELEAQLQINFTFEEN